MSSSEGLHFSALVYQDNVSDIVFAWPISRALTL